MPGCLLKNHLRMYRRKLGLTQDQLVLIMTARSRTRVSALERGLTPPTAEECLAFQRLFGRSVAELWPHLAAAIEKDTDSRMKDLMLHIGQRKPSSARHVERAAYAIGQLASVLGLRD